MAGLDWFFKGDFKVKVPPGVPGPKFEPGTAPRAPSNPDPEAATAWYPVSITAEGKQGGGLIGIGDDAVHLAPLDTEKGQKILRGVSRILRVPIVGPATTAIASRIPEPKTIPYTSIASAKPTKRNGIAVTSDDGSRIDLKLFASAGTLGLSRKNPPVRNSVLGLLQERI